LHQSIRRLKSVPTVLCRAGALSRELLLATIRLAAALKLRPSFRSGTDIQTSLGKTIVRFCERLGPAYIKVGQILSTRQDLFPSKVIAELVRLQDRLPPVRRGEINAAFQADFGMSLAQAFCEFDEQAVATGSIASVYRARMLDGKRVAVKIKRTGIDAIVSADLTLMRLGAHLLSFTPPFRSFPLKRAAAEISESIERQLDFSLEANSSCRLREALSWEDGIVVPRLVDKLCSRSVITMEMLEEFNCPFTSCRSPDRNLRTVLRALYRMIFVVGLIHCDLHPGNLRFVKNGGVAIVDFGFTSTLEYEQRLKFAEFFYSMANGDGQRCAEITIQTAIRVPLDLNYQLFEAQVVALVARAKGVSTGRFNVAAFVAGLFEIQRRFRIVGTTSFLMPIISLLMIEGLAKRVAADIDFQNEAQPYIFRASIRPVSQPQRSLAIRESA